MEVNHYVNCNSTNVCSCGRCCRSVVIYQGPPGLNGINGFNGENGLNGAPGATVRGIQFGLEYVWANVTPNVSGGASPTPATLLSSFPTTTTTIYTPVYDLTTFSLVPFRPPHLVAGFSVKSDGTIFVKGIDGDINNDLRDGSNGRLISSMLECRIFRNIGGFIGPNPSGLTQYPSPNSISLLEIDFHFQKCGNGSGTPFAK